MDKLVPAFKESVFDAHLSDVLSDTIELGINSILDENIFKDIPIFSIVMGISKTAQNIYDRNLLRQTATFIQAFNMGSISPKKLQKYRDKIDSEPQYAEKDLGQVLILLNSYVDSEKSVILAKFYRAYVEKAISWEKFCEFSDVISRIFISDIQLLYKIFNHQVSNTTQCEEYQVDRLVALGLLKTSGRVTEEENSGGGTTVNITDDRNLDCSDLGSVFCRFAK